MKNIIARSIILSASMALLSTTVYAEDIPLMIPYAGEVSVAGERFDGTGLFKFAIVNRSCTIVAEQNQCVTLWSNDGTSKKGAEPADAVQLVVAGGDFQVKLGDTSLSAMTAIPLTVFSPEFTYLRTWFDDGSNGSQLLTNDRQLVSVPYAYRANLANGVSDGSIGANQIKDGEVQKRVAACDAGFSINTVNQDGSVECIQTDTITTGAGLVRNGNEIAIHPDTQDAIDSAVAKSIEAGTGLTSNPNPNTGAQIIAIENSTMTKINSAIQPTDSVNWSQLTGVPNGLADGDNDTTYSAIIGGGLEMNTNRFGIASGGVTGTHLADNAVNVNKIANNAVTNDKINSVAWGKLTNVPVGLSDGDDNTTYSVIPNGGLKQDGTQFGIDTGGVTATHLANNSVNTIELANNAVTTAKIADNAATSRKMSPQYRTANEVITSTNALTIRRYDYASPTRICVTNTYTPETNQVAFIDGSASIYNAPFVNMSPFVAVNDGSGWTYLISNRGRWSSNGGENFWRQSSLVDVYSMFAGNSYQFAIIISQTENTTVTANGYSCEIRAVFYSR